MKRKLLSLALIGALWAALAVPAAAAGSTETVADEAHGVRVTLHNVLRRETHRYLVDDGYKSMSIYVLEDGALVEVEALAGRKYADSEEFSAALFHGGDFDAAALGGFAYADNLTYYWDESEGRFTSGGAAMGYSLAEKWTYTATPFDPAGEEANLGMWMEGGFSVLWMCESDFAKLTPHDTLHAADWAKETLWRAYDTGLFPIKLDPTRDDCTRGMTREEFANVTVNLYAALLGREVYEVGNEIDTINPFTDLKDPSAASGTGWWAYSYEDAVGQAYNLGFVNGTGDTTFSPRDTLTREQAAVMLSRVYARIHGDIPAAAATTFADNAAIGGWAKSGVAFMASRGIVEGVGGNSFAPKKTLSVQEAMAMALRMLEKLK